MGGKGSKKGGKARTFRVLVLGVGGSGKSTFIKQMQIIHNGGFSSNEHEQFRRVIQQNVITGMQELIKQAEKLELNLEAANLKFARRIKQEQAVTTEDWTDAFQNKLEELWKDPTVQQTWRVATHVHVSSLDYLMQHIHRFATSDFVPTNEDILRARQRTTGSYSVEFTKDKLKWELVDVGGQSPERKKWDPLLDEPFQAVIFFAGMDEYNMISTEEKDKTKMETAMEVFRTSMSHPKLADVTKILFLNKSDLFKVKIESDEGFRAFQRAFPEYRGGRDMSDTSDYLIDQFRELLASETGDKLHAHITCALDTEAMSSVFEAVKENIFLKRVNPV